MDTMDHTAFPQILQGIAHLLAKYPDPQMVAFFERCAQDKEGEDPRAEERRDRSLFRFARILTALTPYTADAVHAETDRLRDWYADGMNMSMADAVERSAEEFAVHQRAACAAARAAGFEATCPLFEGGRGEIDMVQVFHFGGRESLTLHVYLDLVVPDVIVSVEHSETGIFDYPDDARQYTVLFAAATATD
ncbi:hypothetical protein [Bifidobacterium pseudolongum]|uniref:hypothetical protein n=1 Tax=Bifidobacterium pseudolongum TaxID=1694 RepID=UPI00101EBD53|nr:hypothetical protein [Bifidobacterium pseudolongum]RYQ65454.1 hypothetical protein PG2103B_1678 [Bifidobacterium pseudolongum subsp. globosum]